ncbi:hypothetical protein BKA70DRAFT_171612 [Coprinopsis sp. MPI-PUGE-AT-0042]|nr:hypothetical protein BKA70DRAFT_171612 [Coprinopsis sp. MPI-PUGE-AT-0042]
MRLSFSFLTLLACSLAGVVYSLPIQSAFDILEVRGQPVVLGYRYVRKQVAEDYIKAGTLTNVPASGVQIGDGAYLSPAPNQWISPDDYWLCRVTADSDEIRALPKLWIPEFLPQQGTAKNPTPPQIGLFYKSNEAARNAYIAKNKMDPAKALLFSKIAGLNPIAYQLLIPPGYLKGAKNAGLSTKVKCYPKNTPGQPTDSAPWGTWSILGFSQG